MARKYARDNRGRFAPKGAGATARGGRLKTASGNKRETQKRMIFSPESRRLAGVSLDASAKSGKINMPVRFGGEGQGYKTPRGKAAAAAATAAREASRAEVRRAGLPKSGGAMRVKGELKRDPGAAAKLASRAKPARAASTPKTGQEIMKANVRSVQNKKLRSLNAQIKDAGTNAAGLRVQKLALQSRMTSTRPKPTAKQQAKQQAQTSALRSRVGRMKRAQARVEATADTRNVPGSKMIRRPDARTSRSNRRAEQARSIYFGASGTSIKNFAKGVARTPRAKNNWRPMRRG